MKIALYFYKHYDYLNDAILYGLLLKNEHEIFTNHKKDKLFKNTLSNKEWIHGLGFTLYHNLPIELMSNLNQLNTDEYYDILYLNPTLLEKEYAEIKKIKFKKLIFIDGNDERNVYPFYKRSLINIRLLNILLFMTNRSYYKRELYYYNYPVSNFIKRTILLRLNLKEISFGIPSLKILTNENHLSKTKNFPEHIVDEELAKNIGKTTKYAFHSESEYYTDLQNSKFGITTKRAGWDCLRHYEIAANGAVICFKNLNLKPDSCAPHGLIDMFNCISYSSADELLEKINNLAESDYRRIRKNGFIWVKSNTCESLVERLLN